MTSGPYVVVATACVEVCSPYAEMDTPTELVHVIRELTDMWQSSSTVTAASRSRVDVLSTTLFVYVAEPEVIVIGWLSMQAVASGRQSNATVVANALASTILPATPFFMAFSRSESISGTLDGIACISWMTVVPGPYEVLVALEKVECPVLDGVMCDPATPEAVARTSMVLLGNIEFWALATATAVASSMELKVGIIVDKK